MVIFADADLDAAVEGLVNGVWFNGGQVCCAGSRVLVQEGVAEEFVAKAKVRMAALRTGDSLDKCTPQCTPNSRHPDSFIQNGWRIVLSFVAFCTAKVRGMHGFGTIVWRA